MVKHTQLIRWQQPTNCLSVCDHFVGLALIRLMMGSPQISKEISETHSESIQTSIQINWFNFSSPRCPQNESSLKIQSINELKADKKLLFL